MAQQNNPSVDRLLASGWGSAVPGGPFGEPQPWSLFTDGRNPQVSVSPHPVKGIVMDRDSEIFSLLVDLRQQDYPLSVTQETANALVECIRRVLNAVPEDDRLFVRADYDLATSALCHPEGDLPRTNTRCTTT